MNCPECRELLLASLDNARTSHGPAAAHLANCADCRALLAACERLREGLSHRRSTPPPAEFPDRVCRLWQDQCRKMRLRRWWAASVAAAVVLGLAGWGISLLSPPEAPPQVRQPPDFQPPAQPPRPLAAASVRTPVACAGQGFASFGSEFTASFARQARPLATNITDTRLPIADAEIPLGRVSRSVAVGLEPLLDSARENLLQLFRTSPPGQPPAVPEEPKPGNPGVPKAPALP